MTHRRQCGSLEKIGLR